MTTETFAQRGRELYGDKYDCSKVEYKGGDVKVCIICPEKVYQTLMNYEVEYDD